MTNKKKHTIIERIAEKLHLIPDLHKEEATPVDRLTEPGDLTKFPPMDQWDDWTEYEATAWPRVKKKNYTIVPTTCFNCESACGLTAYIDKETMEVRKFEGNPLSSRQQGSKLCQRPSDD